MTPITINIYGANYLGHTTHTRIGCRGIVLRGDEMLISHEVNTDWLLIPGGGLEAGESMEACCAREVAEETGYLVKPKTHFLALNEYYEDCLYVSHYFVCEAVGRTESALTPDEAARGLVSEWHSVTEMLDLYAHHEDWAVVSEEKRGAYLREYTALKAFEDLRKSTGRSV